MTVPRADFDRVAARVNALPAVAHNYEREHALNMWFVLATASSRDTAAAIAEIEGATGLAVLAFPKEREFAVDLRLPVLP